MGNLEPIEDKDLNLKEKFNETIKPGAVENIPASTPEAMPVPEQVVERQEGEVEKDKTYNKILSKVKSYTPPTVESVVQDAEAANTAQGAEAKIEKLIQLAMQKGVIHAVKVARHMEDNYTLDEFHDRLLAEELHNALVQKGLIKEI
ncbi:MAG: hypothetical protein NTZ97_03480 [Candidatus Moranbacteria bacterium]|nr:hypothetical protein [Candidatus Moranbacteria bacterium]